MLETDTKSSPITEYFESIGYNPEVNNGKKIMRNYTSHEDELYSIYNGVGLRDISNYGIIELKGKDALDFLHRITTNAVKDLQKENIIDTIFTTEKGRIIDYTSLLNFEDFYLLIGSLENQEKVMKWIDKYVIADDVKQNNINGKYTIFELLGPQAASFIMQVCGNIINNIQPNTFKIINSEGIIFFLAKMIAENRIEKYWIIAEPTNGQQLVKFMVEHKGPFDFSLIGEESYEMYRIEQGIPSAPHEINDQYNPHEAGIISKVSFTKGCYIGQEVIARLDTYDKVQKHLKGVFLSENIDPAAAGDQPINLFSQDKEAGTITSLVNSIKFKRPIGLAYIRNVYTTEETILTGNMEGKTFQAIVQDLPFKK